MTEGALPTCALASDRPTGPPAAIRRPGGYPWQVPAVMVVADSLLLQAIVALATLLRGSLAPWLPIVIGPGSYQGMHAAVLFLPLLYLAAGLTPGYGRAGVERLRLRVKVTLGFFATMLVFDHVAPGGQWSRGILLIAAGLALVLVPLGDALLRHLLMRRRVWGVPVVLLGPAAERARLAAVLHANPELGWVPVLEGEAPPAPPPAAPGVNLALLATEGLGLSALAQAERLPFRKVVLASGTTDAQSLWVASRDLGGQLGLEMQRKLLLPWNRFIKRTLDLLLGAVLLLPAVLIGLPFVAAMQLLSPGPVFFTQQRRGRGGRPIGVIKLRSMHPDAEERLRAVLAASPEARAEWEASLKLRRDPRLVPVLGPLMRRLSVDELPQLLNVLKGEMSIVGPRALPDYHLAALSAAARELRGQVRPGMTGLWQVSGRSALPLAEAERFDGYYVRNWSIWLDVHILARTVPEVLRGRGAW